MTPLAGQPAFPLVGRSPEDDHPIEFYGMTIRQYYAGLAMQALATNDKALLQPTLDLHFDTPRQRHRYFAEVAVSLADALIAELEKK